jgi:hypothetical protein
MIPRLDNYNILLMPCILAIVGFSFLNIGWFTDVLI